MVMRAIIAIAILCGTCHTALGQLPPLNSRQRIGNTTFVATNQTVAGAQPRLSTTSTTTNRQVTNVTKGDSILPNDHGQVWRKYDIRPYTSRVSENETPQQSIIDWILRDTGTDVWFNAPLGFMNATKNTLHVYHTPEMQRIVGDIVDRFVSSAAEAHVFDFQLVTVGSPNWRTRTHSLIQPVPVQSAGVEAWLISKEDAAIVMAELKKRTDFQQHNSPTVAIHNGQSHILTRRRPTNYIRGIQQVWPGQQFDMGQVDEGYSLEISPLFTLDGAYIDSVIKCDIDQIEKLVPITIDVPSPTPQRQRTQVQVPQMVSWRLHERFRWPADKVLLLSCGVVAAPKPDRPNTLGLPLKNPFQFGPGRADALLFIEHKGRASQTLMNARTAPVAASAPNNRGRY